MDAAELKAFSALDFNRKFDLIVNPLVAGGMFSTEVHRAYLSSVIKDFEHAIARDIR